MSKALVPIKSESRQIQPAHIRVLTRQGKKVPVIVNQKVRPRTRYPVQASPRKLSPRAQPIVSMKPRVKWTDVLKYDTGVLDGKTLKDGKIVRREHMHVSIEDLREYIEEWPTRHEDEWEEEYINDPLKKLNELISAKEIEAAEIDDILKEIGKEATKAIQWDMDDPILTLTLYSDGEPETGYIAHYSELGDFDVSDWDVTWHGNGYRGHYEFNPPDDYNEIYDGMILSWAESTKQLENLFKEFKTIMAKRKIPFIIGVTRSSNVLYQPMALFVPKEHAKTAANIIKILEKKHIDPGQVDRDLNPLAASVDDVMKRGAISKEDLLKAAKDVVPEDSEAYKMLKDAVKEDKQ